MSYLGIFSHIFFETWTQHTWGFHFELCLSITASIACDFSEVAQCAYVSESSGTLEWKRVLINETYLLEDNGQFSYSKPGIKITLCYHWS